MEVAEALDTGSFELVRLTNAINNVDAPKTRLAELNLFEEDGVDTTSIKIEYKEGMIQLVTDVPRGDDGEPLEDDKRALYTFDAVHLPVPAKIMADDIKNVRAFGEESELEPLQEKIDEKLIAARMSIDVTIEYLRFGAIFGKVYGKKGNVIVDLFDVFKIKKVDGEDTVDFNKPLRTQLLDVKRHSEDHQKGIKATGYRVLCRRGFFDQMLENEDFFKAFERQNDGQALRDDVRAGVFWQGVYWEEYNETLGEKDPMPSEYGAVMIPTGKRGLYLTKFAYANYTGAVNTKGLPYYTNSEPMKMNKGIELESQSNPINVCTSPLAVRRIKFTPKAAK
ncbi:major capsid protein [Pseudoalteromonas umbrosa]|uniref:major capsid protein n=1 Tax=Pseudoalteromonas umbrosa TaxID=3048489 RepID=UPI0024C34484|nr:major capsid protein [Pseudoalteromonas sp. B95]MDK1289785.1 major capsid protein [Pseudoalteromonas sp. B95]